MNNVNPLSVSNFSPVYEVITQTNGTKLIISDFAITQRNYIPLIGFLSFEQTIGANGWVVTHFGANKIGLSTIVSPVENQNNYATEFIQILALPEAIYRISDLVSNNDQLELITEIQSILNENKYGSSNAEPLIVYVSVKKAQWQTSVVVHKNF